MIKSLAHPPCNILIPFSLLPPHLLHAEHNQNTSLITKREIDTKLAALSNEGYEPALLPDSLIKEN